MTGATSGAGTTYHSRFCIFKPFLEIHIVIIQEIKYSLL